MFALAALAGVGALGLAAMYRGGETSDPAPKAKYPKTVSTSEEKGFDAPVHPTQRKKKKKPPKKAPLPDNQAAPPTAPDGAIETGVALSTNIEQMIQSDFEGHKKRAVPASSTKMVDPFDNTGVATHNPADNKQVPLAKENETVVRDLNSEVKRLLEASDPDGLRYMPERVLLEQKQQAKDLARTDIVPEVAAPHITYAKVVKGLGRKIVAPLERIEYMQRDSGARAKRPLPRVSKDDERAGLQPSAIDFLGVQAPAKNAAKVVKAGAEMLSQQASTMRKKMSQKAGIMDPSIGPNYLPPGVKAAEREYVRDSRDLAEPPQRRKPTTNEAWGAIRREFN